MKDVFTLSKDYSYYKNKANGENFNVSTGSLTNALIYFSNLSVACSNIESCDSRINLLLIPNNYSYILNKFNLTEGVNRDKSPLWISSVVATADERRYYLSSNLTNTVNISLHPKSNVACPISIVYKSNSSTYNYFANYSCSGGFVSEINISGYEPSSINNLLTLSYAFVGGSGGGAPDYLTLPEEPEPEIPPTIPKEEKENYNLLWYLIIGVLGLYFILDYIDRRKYKQHFF